MRNTNDKENLQCAGLNAVLLMGGYSVCGRVSASDAASYTLAWMISISICVIVWFLASFIRPLKRTSGTGRTLASLLASSYLIFAAGMYINGFIMIWQQWSLPNTPRLLLSAAAALAALYGGSRGIRPVLRLCLPVVLTVLILFLVDTALLFPEMTVARLSVADAAFEFKSFLRLSLALMLPLPAALLMQQPMRVEKRVYFFSGAFMGSAYLLLTVLRSVLVLGPLSVLGPYPLLRALMLVSMGPGLGRMEAGGIMALSAAMLAAAMAFTAGAFSFLSSLRWKWPIKTAVFMALAALGFF